MRTHYVQFLTQSLAHSRCSSLASPLFFKKKEICFAYIVDDALISSSAVVCASLPGSNFTAKAWRFEKV